MQLILRNDCESHSSPFSSLPKHFQTYQTLSLAFHSIQGEYNKSLFALNWTKLTVMSNCIFSSFFSVKFSLKFNSVFPLSRGCTSCIGEFDPKKSTKSDDFKSQQQIFGETTKITSKFVCLHTLSEFQRIPRILKGFKTEIQSLKSSH